MNIELAERIDEVPIRDIQEKKPGDEREKSSNKKKAEPFCNFLDRSIQKDINQISCQDSSDGKKYYRF
ncbi:hypothetical protein ES703_97367 [subsurface metagenome]